MFNTDRIFATDTSFLLKQGESADAFSSQPRMSSHYVQKLRHPDDGSQLGADQNSDYFVYPLNQYAVAPHTSETNFILTYDFDGIQPEELDRYLDTSSKASNNLMLTELNPCNFTHPPLQGSSVNFSQPSSHPVTIANPLNKNTQQQVVTETVECIDPESFGIGELGSVKPAGTHTGYNKQKYQAYYTKNRDIILANKKKYREKNKDIILAKKRKYNQENRDIILAQKKNYYAKNKDTILAKRKDFYEKNRDIVLAIRKKL